MSTSCKEKSSIELAFDKYVAENIDDPSSFKELVAVSRIDSVDFTEWADNGRKMIELSEQSDSLVLEFSDLTKKTKFDFTLPQYKSTVNYIKMHMTFWENNTINELTSREKLKKAIEKIDTANSKLMIYEIKSRFKENNELKLKTFYATENNKGEIVVSSEKTCIENYDGSNIDIINSCKEYQFFSVRKQNLLDALMELMVKMKQ